MSLRPLILDRLFKSVKSLSGVGPRNHALFLRLTGERLVDLIFHLPSAIIDRRNRPKIAQLQNNMIATCEVEIINHVPSKIRSKPYRIKVQDDTAIMELAFFHAKGDYLLKQFPLHEKRIISGKVEFFGGTAQMAHPDYNVPINKAGEIPALEPVYPATAGLSNKVIKKAIDAAMKDVPALPEWQDKTVLSQRHWHGFLGSLERLHAPENAQDILPKSIYRQRIAYDELLAEQLAMALVRHHHKKTKGIARIDNGELKKKALAALPFKLTNAQTNALKDICADIRSEQQMMRLVQGDVGSGKTMVAFFALLHTIESGYQGTLMAPTEILARQHAAGLQPLCEKIGINLVVLTGRDKGKNRAALLEKIENGQAQIIIGTHALFQENVRFKNLGLVVIDEQHRFGVGQRLALSEKGQRPDILVMTATPIPRTLTLTLFGDMDVSILNEKPAGRKPIDTRLVSQNRLGDVVESIKRKIAQNEKIYWVCPLVEESEILDLAAAESRYETLKNVIGNDKVALIHGRMKGDEKDAIMQQFKDPNGSISVLIATTVIEVGVDVPDATVIIIEHAERFGLSQLHQLRGRVGRGEKASSCILLYGQPLGKIARQRLDIMRESEDGFYLAEKDLELRGAGELLGTRQSGLPEYKIANLEEHMDLLKMANDEARLIINKNPNLEGDRGDALRLLLYLFEKDNAIRYLKAG